MFLAALFTIGKNKGVFFLKGINPKVKNYKWIYYEALGSLQGLLFACVVPSKALDQILAMCSGGHSFL